VPPVRGAGAATHDAGPRFEADRREREKLAARFCRALVTAFAEAGPGRTPEAAAGVMLNVVGKLRQQTAASDARISSGSKRRGNV
jgi:hypothetical protein